MAVLTFVIYEDGLKCSETENEDIVTRHKNTNTIIGHAVIDAFQNISHFERLVVVLQSLV